MDWNYDLNKCPKDPPVWLLSDDDFPVLPQNEYLGTIIDSKQGYLTKGECFYGDPDYFYISKIIAWREVDWNLLLSFSCWCDKSGINYEYIDALPEKNCRYVFE